MKLLWLGIALTIAALISMIYLLPRRTSQSEAKFAGSAVSTVGYDAQARQLRLRFASGEQYAYYDVPDEVHRAFLEAKSKGRFFQAMIRDRYRYRRL